MTPRPRLVQLWMALASTCACGDPSDAELALPVGGLGSQPPGSPARTVVSIQLDDSAKSCPTLDISLPGPSARETLVDALGERLVDPNGGRVRCRVEPEAGGDSFQIELRVEPSGGPSVQIVGTLSGAQEDGLSLEILIPQGLLRSECAPDVREVRAGAVWFRALSCGQVFIGSEPVACTVSVAALFENCQY